MRTKTYIDYITYSPEKRTSATGLADALQTAVGSHDEVTRWLANSNLTPAQLWAEVKGSVDLTQGHLVADDTVIEKPHTAEASNNLVKYYHGSDGLVKGINVVTLLWVHGQRCVAIDYRIVEKGGDATKNDMLREMLRTAKRRGFREITVLFDSWYAANETLKLISRLGFEYVTRLKKNRRVNVNGANIRISTLTGKNARVVGIPGVGDVKVIVTDTDAILAASNLSLNKKSIIKKYGIRWRIEEFFRATKQVYRLAGCQARRSAAWANHIYASFLAYSRNDIAGLDHYEIQNTAYRQMLGGYLVIA
jgi:putative transposase